MLEVLGKIQSNIELAGLNSEDNYSDDLIIKNDQVLDLVDLIKNIKLSIGCSIKFGSVWYYLYVNYDFILLNNCIK